MAAADSVLQKFSGALQALYEAAGRPVYSTLLQLDGRKISDATLSEWFNGQGVPGKGSEEYFRALILHLNSKAARKRTSYEPLLEGQWMGWLRAARQERDQNRGGRPRAHPPPERTPGRQRKDATRHRRDRVFTSHKAWIEQLVRPATLLDRQNELQELEEFCTAPDVEGRPVYAWWQAEPWAGKSALMAEFVSQRSADVEVVSYFIGDRFGNNDRDSFLQEVSQQLAVVADRDTSASGSRPEEFPELCQAAAEACRGRGRRLVLMVDGLDEDRGAGPGGLSIASLLPKSPPAGMRVVVTGRHNPPVPDGVPPDHPLRDPETVRLLASSPHARHISDMAGRELQQLLNDVPVGNDLLGFLTVARGALTSRDLSELIGVRPHDISRRLRGTTGRSFLTTESGYLPAPGAEGDFRTFVLGHQELRRKALAELGGTAVAEYDARLHAWADDFQARGWPPDTPPYLLYDYPGMLRGASKTDRLVSFALDPHRQLALLARSSIDAALSEVELTHQVIARETPGDLGTAVALAASRDLLYADARALPPSVSVAFARLGDPQRAMGLARSAPHPVNKAIRLAKVARVLASTDHQHATEAAQEAARWADRARREAAPPSGDEYDTEVAVGEVAVALISVGLDRQGRDLLDSLWPPAMSGDETLKCRKAAEASLAARPRSPELAEELLSQAERYADELASGSPSDPAAPVRAWEVIARAAGSAGAARMHGRISEYANALPACLESSTVLATAASALVADQPDEAAALAQQAAGELRAALRAPESLPRDDAAHLEILLEPMLAMGAQALVDTGAVDDARELVACVPDTMRTGWLGRDVLAGARVAIGDAPRGVEEAPSAEALAEQTCQLAEQGRPDEAKSRLQEALAAFASSPGGGWSREAWLTTLCGALAGSGWLADGERLARSLHDPAEQVRALAAVAISTAAAGHLAEAGRFAHEAADRARALEGADNFSLLRGAPGHSVAVAKGAAAQALAHAGERDLALSLAEEVGGAESGRSRRTLLAVAAGLRAHDPATAAELIERERERLLAADTDRGSRIVKLAELIAAIGDAHPACKDQLVQTTERVWSEERASGKRPDVEDVLVAVVLASPEQREEAHRALETLTRKMASAPPWEMPTGGFAVAHAAFGDYDAARRAANRHNVPADRTEAFAAVAAYLTLTPADIQPRSDSTSTAFTQTLRSLVSLERPPTTAETSESARRFVADALAGQGWHHVLPVLARIAPEAVGRIRDIVFTHRRLEISEAHPPTERVSQG